MKTLKTLVLKTATVTGVKPATPADRIGLGLVVAYPAHPTDNLSPGHFSMPQNPEPDQVRSRQLSAMQPRMRWQGGDVVPPAGPAGCFPGASAVRSTSISARQCSRASTPNAVVPPLRPQRGKNRRPQRPWLLS